jgi:hypothetical protein
VTPLHRRPAPQAQPVDAVAVEAEDAAVAADPPSSRAASPRNSVK